MIQVCDVTKEYKISIHKPGLLGSIQGLFKRNYQIKRAVEHISFQIEQGELVGYIGVNGAGKSTTIKMLCGILHPTHGEICVNGIIPYKDRQQNAKQIGAVFGQRTQLFWDIPVRESLDLLKHIYEIPESEYRQTLRQFTDLLDLEPLLGIPVRQLSLGQKMRCELAAAFLHKPKVVYLDEPTIGLDIAVKAKIRQFIKDMNQLHNTTIILTTHDMQDIEEICSRILILDAGRILYDGSLASIKERFGHMRVIQFELDPSTPFQLPSKLKGLVEPVAPTSEHGRDTSCHVRLSFSNSAITASEVIAAVMQHHTVRDLTIEESSIETIVKDIYARGMKEECEYMLN